MNLVYKGKTKNVYDNGNGNYLLQSCVRLNEFFFKKDAHEPVGSARSKKMQ